MTARKSRLQIGRTPKGRIRVLVDSVPLQGVLLNGYREIAIDGRLYVSLLIAPGKVDHVALTEEGEIAVPEL